MIGCVFALKTKQNKKHILNGEQSQENHTIDRLEHRSILKGQRSTDLLDMAEAGTMLTGLCTVSKTKATLGEILRKGRSAYRFSLLRLEQS